MSPFFLPARNTQQSSSSKSSSSSAKRRLKKDFITLKTDPPEGISGTPVDNNIFEWQAIIFGPAGTVWEGGTFTLSLSFTEEYPNIAPKVKFITKLFHPNVYADGSICLDILREQWSPVFDISAILTSIQSLLCDPNPKSPANAEAARLYQENRRAYNRKVRNCVEASWTAPPDGTIGSGGAASSSSSSSGDSVSVSGTSGIGGAGAGSSGGGGGGATSDSSASVPNANTSGPGS